MPPSTFSRMGASNAGNNRLQLFKAQVTAEILKTFENEGPLDQFTTVRSITSGKSAIFPYIGNIGGGFHTPGTELVGTNQTIRAAEKIISVDGQYISHVWINNLDEVMDSYDLRSAYAVELGRALVRNQGHRLGRMLCRAARSVGVLANAIASDSGYKNYGASGAAKATSTLGVAGSTAGQADNAALRINAALTASNFRERIWNAVRIMDQKNVPQNDRYVIMRPAEFYLLLSSDTTTAGAMHLNKDIGGVGSYAQGTLPMLAGCQVVKTNYLPNGNVTEAFSTVNPGQGTFAETKNDETYVGNNYGGDFRKTIAVVTNKQAVGTVRLLDMLTETEYYAMYQATLLLAKFAQGHGVLRPECACEITQDATDGTVADADLLPSD